MYEPIPSTHMSLQVTQTGNTHRGDCRGEEKSDSSERNQAAHSMLPCHPKPVVGACDTTHSSLFPAGHFTGPIEIVLL